MRFRDFRRVHSGGSRLGEFYRSMRRRRFGPDRAFGMLMDGRFGGGRNIRVCVLGGDYRMAEFTRVLMRDDRMGLGLRVIGRGVRGGRYGFGNGLGRRSAVGVITQRVCGCRRRLGGLGLGQAASSVFVRIMRMP
jgi:hypothetical protein